MVPPHGGGGRGVLLTPPGKPHGYAEAPSEARPCGREVTSSHAAQGSRPSRSPSHSTESALSCLEQFLQPREESEELGRINRKRFDEKNRKKGELNTKIMVRGHFLPAPRTEETSGLAVCMGASPGSLQRKGMFCCSGGVPSFVSHPGSSGSAGVSAVWP